MLEKTEHMVILIDFYGPLLTDKQQQVLNLYYENDWSLSEIAESLNVTRQAVFDILKRAEYSLLEYEKKLKLVEKFNYTRIKLQELYELLDTDNIERERLTVALNILQELKDNV